MRQFLAGLLVATAVLVLPLSALSQAPATFNYIEQQIITSTDPAVAVDEASLIAMINLYDPLLYPNVAQGTMDPRPHIAESWTVSADGKTYTIKLRRGIKFHSGRELTADDVVFSMDRALRLKKGFSWVWTPVLDPGRVKAVDKSTVRFELKAPYAPFLGSLLLFFILDKDLVMKNIATGPYGEFGDYGAAFLERADAGSGPYRMDRFDRATEMVFVRFDDYWRGWQPNKISRVSFKTVEEEATVKTLIRSGQADMVNQWLSVQGFTELRQSSGIVVKEDPSVQLFHLEMNTKRPPLDNKKVRQAIAYAFEYDTAIQQIFQGATKARGPVPVRVPGWNPKLPAYAHNVAKAKQLLAESGVSPAALSIEYGYVVTLPQERQIGLLLKSNLEAIGFKVEIQGEPWARIVERATRPETTPHITAIFDTLKYPHVDSHTYGLYHPSCWGTFRCMSFYESSNVTQLLERARRAVDPAEQMKLYQEAQALIMEDAPSVYVANPLHRIAYRDYVKGYRYVGLLGFDVAFYDFTVAK